MAGSLRPARGSARPGRLTQRGHTEPDPESRQDVSLSAEVPAALLTDRELFNRSHEHGDPDARRELVERFLPFARKLAVRYSYTDEPIEDLVQVAAIGLLGAVDRFDPARGSKFTSFAAPTILGE